nr:glycosyltransferase [Streptococcus thermophilus]
MYGFIGKSNLSIIIARRQSSIIWIDIFVLPSTNPDPLPTVVLEAMACGKPVVGYHHGGVCEMVKEGENGHLAIPNQPAELSKANQELADNTEKREIWQGLCQRPKRTLFITKLYS